MDLIFKLLVGHAIADFALQSRDMNEKKNRNSVPNDIAPGKAVAVIWPYWMTAHSLIHGGTVYIATGSLLFGTIETVLHWVIDFAKCEKWTNSHQDQLLHIICKGAYAYLILTRGITP